MKANTKIFAIIMTLFLLSCSSDYIDQSNETTTLPDSYLSKNSSSKNSISILWDFNDLTGWEDATQVGLPNYWLENGNLTVFTNPNTWERAKIKTLSTFTTGIYTWKIYVPEMGVGDMASIGAFLYNNDTHELDFEVGYGKQLVRNELNAQADDLLVYMTSQGNPFQSYVKKIKRGQWHTFSMELTLNSKQKYVVSWYINGEQAATTQLNYGTKNKFKIFCSLENLTFIGDHIPNSQNYALFDFVEYRGN